LKAVRRRRVLRLPTKYLVINTQSRLGSTPQNVRFWPIADTLHALTNVRFRGQSGRPEVAKCPLMTQSGHCGRQRRLWCQVACRAFSIHPIKWSASYGLFNKPIAPAFIARARVRSSGWPVIKMIGMRCPSAISWSCRSRPLSPGICRSVMRHNVSCSFSDL
jgi:hypothetical protein